MSPQSCRDEAIEFVCADETLTGILTRPSVARGPAVLIVVGGPQYRAGSHRQFVLLSRRLAASGHAVLRFDVRGMGDSGGALRNFEQIGEDIGAAVDTLAAAAPEHGQVILWGLCDGASAALLYLQERGDPRIAGLCLVNPWVRSEAGLARTQLKHYYRQRLLQKDFWLKLLSGRVAGRALRELGQSIRLAQAARRTKPAASSTRYQDRMAQGLGAFGGPVQLLLSSEDYTAREFVDHAALDPRWRKALGRPGVSQVELSGADHTCSDLGSQALMERLCVQWLAQHWHGELREHA